MNGRRIAWVAGLGLAVLGAGFLAREVLYTRASNAADAAVEIDPPRPEPAAAERLAVIRRADAITDPMQRCLEYPAPYGYDWDPALVAALCHDAFDVPMEPAQVATFVDRADFPGLDARLDAVLDGYFNGTVTEGAWFALYRNSFRDTGTAMAEQLDAWVSQRPNSAQARLARAVNRLASAWEVRGQDTAANTPPEAMERMRAIATGSIADAEKAIALEARLLPAHATLITAATLVSRREQAQRTLEHALAVKPDTYSVRLAYVTMLQPRWGGSMPALSAFVEDAQEHAASNPRIPQLLGYAEAELVRSAYIAGRHKEAAAVLDAAIRYGPACPNLCRASDAHQVLRHWVRAVELDSQMLRVSPHDASARANRAISLARLGESEWALSEFEAAMADRPDDYDIERNYAWLLGELERHGDAVAFLQRVHARAPAEPMVNRELATLLLYRTDRAAEAGPYIDTLIEHDPDDGAAWLMRMDYLRATGDEGLVEAAERFVEVADEGVWEQELAKEKTLAWLRDRQGSGL